MRGIKDWGYSQFSLQPSAVHHGKKAKNVLYMRKLPFEGSI